MGVFKFSVDVVSGKKDFELETGCSIFFVGANGSGKTRLAATIEDRLGMDAHRISAHRALNLNPSVPKISQSNALNTLWTGSLQGNPGNRTSHRWGNKSPTLLLNDYDSLIQSLFAEQNNRALETHNKNRIGDTTKAPPMRAMEATSGVRRVLRGSRRIFCETNL